MADANNYMERDQALPLERDRVMERLMGDLTGDPDVLAIYLSGSLAKGNFDRYSDIDIHAIVKPEAKQGFIENKRRRAAGWGRVLFYEDPLPSAPVVVTHFDCFVKIDSWYHAPEEVAPSIWLKHAKALYDPQAVISPVLQESSKLVYKVSAEEFEVWQSKVLAFAHETYRSAMRKERSGTLQNLDRVCWLVAAGWHMEMDEHFDAAYGSWSKVEGAWSSLTDHQLLLLESWRGGTNEESALQALKRIKPELLRLYSILGEKVHAQADERKFEHILDMIE